MDVITDNVVWVVTLEDNFGADVEIYAIEESARDDFGANRFMAGDGRQLTLWRLDLPEKGMPIDAARQWAAAHCPPVPGVETEYVPRLISQHGDLKEEGWFFDGIKRDKGRRGK